MDLWLLRAALTLAAAAIAFVALFVLPRRGKPARGGGGGGGGGARHTEGVPAVQAPAAAPPSGLASGEAVEARVQAADGEAEGASGGLAALAPPFGLLELARAHNAGPDGAAESDLFVAVLPAEPAADLVLRHLGFDGLGAFMATCVSRAAAIVAWRDCERESECGVAIFRVWPGLRFSNRRRPRTATGSRH